MKLTLSLLTLLAYLLFPVSRAQISIPASPPKAPGASDTPPAVSAPAEPDFPMEFLFSSGAGAWGTTLILNADGSFSGNFGDSDMGDLDEAYPNGTHYYCSFYGRFDSGAPLGPQSQPLMLTELFQEAPEGSEYIEDGIRYISSAPYGLEGGVDFMFYTPDTPVSELDEELLSWWPGRYETTPSETLDCYCLWNVDGGCAFFTYPDP